MPTGDDCEVDNDAFETAGLPHRNGADTLRTCLCFEFYAFRSEVGAISDSASYGI